MSNLNNVVFITDPILWAEAGMAKKMLAWQLKNNKAGVLDKAIEQTIALIRSFQSRGIIQEEAA